MSMDFNGWDFGSAEMHSKVKYIAVMRGDLDLTNAYGLDNDEELSEFLRYERSEGDYSRLYVVFEVAGVVAPNEK